MSRRKQNAYRMSGPIYELRFPGLSRKRCEQTFSWSLDDNAKGRRASTMCFSVSECMAQQ